MYFSPTSEAASHLHCYTYKLYIFQPIRLYTVNCVAACYLLLHTPIETVLRQWQLCSNFFTHQLILWLIEAIDYPSYICAKINCMFPLQLAPLNICSFAAKCQKPTYRKVYHCMQCINSNLHIQYTYTAVDWVSSKYNENISLNLHDYCSPTAQHTSHRATYNVYK